MRQGVSGFGKRAGGILIPLFVCVLLSSCGRFQMPSITMPQIKMPQLAASNAPVETPEQVGARIKPLMKVRDVKPTSLNAINVLFRYEGSAPVKRATFEAYYLGQTYTAYAESIRPGSEFLVRFRDERIDTYRMDFAGLSWNIRDAEEYKEGTFKNYHGGTKPISRIR